MNSTVVTVKMKVPKKMFWERRSLKQWDKQGQDVSMTPAEKQVLVLWHYYICHVPVKFDRK